MRFYPKKMDKLEYALPTHLWSITLHIILIFSHFVCVRQILISSYFSLGWSNFVQGVIGIQFSALTLNSWMRQTNISIFTLKALWRFSPIMFLKFKNLIWNVGCINIIEAAILLNASRPLNHFEHILNRGITFVDKEVTFNNKYSEEKVEEWSYKKSDGAFRPLLQSNFVDHHYQPSPSSSKSLLPS